MLRRIFPLAFFGRKNSTTCEAALRRSEGSAAVSCATANRRSVAKHAFAAIAPPLLGAVLLTQLLGRLITTRGCFPDHPIRPSMKTAGGDRELYGLLKTGVILLCAKDFEVWYRKERKKERWPSQQSRMKKTGRPSVRIQGLKDAILVALREGKTTVAELRRRLEAAGRNLPSLDTLARLVDQLHSEMGGPELLRKPSRRR